MWEEFGGKMFCRWFWNILLLKIWIRYIFWLALSNWETRLISVQNCNILLAFCTLPRKMLFNKRDKFGSSGFTFLDIFSDTMACTRKGNFNWITSLCYLIPSYMWPKNFVSPRYVYVSKFQILYNVHYVTSIAAVPSLEVQPPFLCSR